MKELTLNFPKLTKICDFDSYYKHALSIRLISDEELVRSTDVNIMDVFFCPLFISRLVRKWLLNLNIEQIGDFHQHIHLMVLHH